MSNLQKYNYQTSRDDGTKEIELEAGANVKQFKEKIAKEYNVNDISKIKVIFAGKDLLDYIVLNDLKVGNATLFVYIRSDEDLQLRTAKALRVDGNNSSNEYEYEYEESSEEN